MKELFERLEKHIVTHLWDVGRDMDEHDGVQSSQQIEDVDHCLSSIRKMREILDKLR